MTEEYIISDGHLAALRELHHAFAPSSAGPLYCDHCRDLWPCEMMLLLLEIARLREVLEDRAKLEEP